MKYLKRSKNAAAAVMLLFLSFATHAKDSTSVITNTVAQKASDPEMADVMRANGKIYVVVAVLTIIFIGIVVYLISLNRKLNKLERLIKEK
jgi:CcmD family protein